MGKRNGISLLMLMALPAFASDVVVPVPRLQHNPVLTSIPDGNLLMHGQYRLNGRFQYFTSSEPGAVDTAFGDTADPEAAAVEAQNLNYSSELLFGIENRAEVGIQYGRALSFSLKALVWREDLFWPDIVFGARNLFGSQEGGLYGVTNSKTLKGLQSESYMTLAKTFAGRSRLHAGVSVLTHSTKGYASINGGLEQSLGKGAYLGYEVFERFSDFHQVFTLQWRYRDLVGFSISMTEFQSWIRQDGQWGFFMTPSKNNPDGYNSPGISFSLQVLGWVPHREKRTLPERVAILEVKNAELQRQVEELELVKQRLTEIEQHGFVPAPAGDSAAPAEGEAPAAAAEPPGPAQQAAILLREISIQSESDLSDPRAIREMMFQVSALGPEAAEVVKHTAADTAAGTMRVQAVLIMAQSKDPAYEGSLRALCADNDPRIRRESLSALVKLGSRAALEDAKRLLSDPDETVALAAGEAYRQLKAAPKPAPASRKRR